MNMTLVIIIVSLAIVAIAAYIRYGGTGSHNTTDINIWDKLRLRSQSANERQPRATIKDSTAHTGDAIATASGDAVIEKTTAGRNLKAEAGITGAPSDPKDLVQ